MPNSFSKIDSIKCVFLEIEFIIRLDRTIHILDAEMNVYDF